MNMQEFIIEKRKTDLSIQIYDRMRKEGNSFIIHEIESAKKSRYKNGMKESLKKYLKNAYKMNIDLDYDMLLGKINDIK